MDIVTYQLRSGKETIDKAPGAALHYGIDLTDYLTLVGAGVTVTGVTAAVTGVTLATPAYVSGNTVAAQISGGDMTDGATNSCAFTFTMSNTDIDVRTIYFRMVNK